jgi:hypothetical protein
MDAIVPMENPASVAWRSKVSRPMSAAEYKRCFPSERVGWTV